MISFRLFGIPAEIRPSFLLVLILFGFFAPREGFSPMVTAATWSGLLIGSVLLHELGHAIVARGFGAGEVRIVLHSIVGLTMYNDDRNTLSAFQKVGISAAGSGVGLLFGGLVWLMILWWGSPAGWLSYFTEYLILINVWWGLLNWLPLRPLDGGHIVLGVLEISTPKHAQRIAAILFPVSSGLVLLLAIRYGVVLAALFAGALLIYELNPRMPAEQREAWTPEQMPDNFLFTRPPKKTGESEEDEPGPPSI